MNAIDIPGKSSLRKALSDIRTRLPKQWREEAAQALIPSCLSLLAPYRTIAAYMPIGSEISPLPLVDALENAGKTIALPVVLRHNHPMVFRQWEKGEMLVKDACNIPAPLPSAQEVIPDAVIVPVLGFTASGFRLGYGAGYYDRTLHMLQQQGFRPFCIGLAFDCQEENFPPEAHDQPMDALVTETRVIIRN